MNCKLIGYEELVSTSNSASTEEHVKKARNKLHFYSKAKEFLNPVSVCEWSILMVMNLLADHCEVGTAKALGIDAINSLVQCLIILYRNTGHKKDGILTKRNTPRK